MQARTTRKLARTTRMLARTTRILARTTGMLARSTRMLATNIYPNKIKPYRNNHLAPFKTRPYCQQKNVSIISEFDDDIKDFFLHYTCVYKVHEWNTVLHF